MLVKLALRMTKLWVLQTSDKDLLADQAYPAPVG